MADLFANVVDVNGNLDSIKVAANAARDAAMQNIVVIADGEHAIQGSTTKITTNNGFITAIA